MDAQLSEYRLSAEEEYETDSGFANWYRVVRTGYQMANLLGKLRVDEKTTCRRDRREATEDVDTGDFQIGWSGTVRL